MEPKEIANIIVEIINSMIEVSGHNVSETSKAELEKALVAAQRSKVEDYHRIEDIVKSINVSEVEDHINEILNLHIEIGRIGIWNAGLGAAIYDFMYTLN